MTSWMLTYLRILLILGVLQEANTDVNIDQATIAQWAKEFGSKLYQLSVKYSGAESLRKEYDSRNDLKVENIDGLDLVKEMATNMENMLEDKVSAVENLRDNVEKAHELHVYNESLKIKYFNSNLINTNTTGKKDKDTHLRLDFELEPNDHFNNIPVNVYNSSVQVPANVYNYGDDVLKGIAETESLNKVFQANYERDSTLTWQYFGHNTGFFRNYPGIEWETDDRGLDLYDCRKRGWYISSATSPKDIVILIDTSGSMTGVRYEVAKHTVNTIMSTLGDDDFFNVLSFSDNTKFIQPCFNGTLVQANADNKNLIKQGLSQMAYPKNIADLEQALTEAFELLETFNNTGMGANCNQAIMLITDGSHENYKQIFDTYNKDRHVRVFTYLIGADISDDANIQWMSCKNKGYYTRIGAIADVEENASKYIHVLSRPMVIDQDHVTVWTNVYMDTLVNEGLQLMTTVSQPVFNLKESNREQGILLGVAGVDVPVKELLKLTPAYKLGVNGYPFAITNNGYILYHPDLRPKDKDGQLKPNYNSVDLAEVELSDKDEQLRTAMVDRKTGYMNMTVRMHSKDMKRLYFRLNHYYYTDLAKTPFSLGIVISSDMGHNQLIGFETFKMADGDGENPSFIGDISLISQGLENLFGGNQTNRIMLSDWVYCHLNNTEVKTMSRLEALETYLLLARNNNGRLSKKCDADLINHVIFDANATRSIVIHWEEVYNDQTSGDGVVLSFVGTKGGLTRIYQHHNGSKQSNFGREFENTIEEEYYQRAATVSSNEFVYSVPLRGQQDGFTSDGSTYLVTGSSPLLINQNGSRTIPATIGYQILLSTFTDLFMETTLSLKKDCNDVAFHCQLTCYNDSVACYLLDEHGYIVMSKDKHEMGRLFASLTDFTRVFSRMLEHKVYTGLKQIDYQAMCEEYKVHESAGSHILDPLLSMTTFFVGFTKQLMLILSHLIFFYTWDLASFEAQGARTVEFLYEPCDQEMIYYTAETTRLPLHGFIQSQCDDCRKYYSMHRIPHSNLMLLVVDSDCHCDVIKPIKLTPTRVVYNEVKWCQRLRTRVHRRRPEPCHSQHFLENSTDCGRGIWLQPSSQVTLLMLITKRILTQMMLWS